MRQVGPSVIAVVPARGGSKSIPRKNLRSLEGHPLIAWSIAAGLRAPAVGAVVVSTDDHEIAEVARAYGADVPFLRPGELARDETPDLPVFVHALQWLERERGWCPEVVIQLRPTSPYRPAGMVDEAVALLKAHPSADSVRAVTSPGENPFKMWRLQGDFLQPLHGTMEEELFNQPRQRLPTVFWQTGHLDAFRRATVLEAGSLTGRRVVPFFVDPRYALDIDTPEQWAFAEWLVGRSGSEIVRPAAGATRRVRTQPRVA
jgi:N-acylneuraminate cytidylyltransferase